MLNGSFKSIFSFLTVLGGVLSVSGIFSLASIHVARRTKEIGIRKALGATVTSVIMLLNKQFVIVLVLAAIIGSVAGFYLIDGLLGVFNMKHISVGIITVALCSLGIGFAGLITTTFTILRAAGSNPVETLRSYE